MDEFTRDTLAVLIRAYQRRVAVAAELLRAGLGLENLMLWREAGIAQTGHVGGVRYYFHGAGVAIHLPQGVIDFDFGHDGRIDRFSAWKLAAFAEGIDSADHRFTNWVLVRDLLQEGVREGWLHQSSRKAEDDLYYFAQPIAA